MSTLLLLTNALQPSAEVLPALGLLLHRSGSPPPRGRRWSTRPAPTSSSSTAAATSHRPSLCQLLRTTGLDCPLLAS